MAERAEVLGDPPHPPRVVDHHAGDVGDGAVEDHRRPLLGRHPDRRVRDARAAQDEPLHGRHRPVDRLTLQPARLPEVGQEQGVAGLGGGVLRPRVMSKYTGLVTSGITSATIELRPVDSARAGGLAR